MAGKHSDNIQVGLVGAFFQFEPEFRVLRFKEILSNRVLGSAKSYFAMDRL